MSAYDARKLVRDMGPTARLSTDNGKSDLLITAVHISSSRMKIDVKGGAVAQVALKELNPSDLCNSSECYIFLGGDKAKEGLPWIILSSPGTNAANRLTDALLKLKQAALNGRSPETDALFQEAVRSYRASAPKPQLPEAARRFKVMAEGAIRDKDFAAAADSFEQALDVAPWWPDGHFNRAIVLSETGDFPEAVAEMKRYLALVPDASDARAAQDKIYDWERRAGAQN